jgi:hypothetical protein
VNRHLFLVVQKSNGKGMKNFLKTTWSDIVEKQKNVELYLVLLVIVVIFIADIFGVETSSAITEIFLAALAILIYSTIDTRHFNEQIEDELKGQANRLDNLENHYASIAKRLDQLSQASTYLNRADAYVSLLEAINSATDTIFLRNGSAFLIVDAIRGGF